MSVETDFRALLAAHAGTAALVGARIALNAAAEDAGYPLVVYSVTHDRTLGLDNTLLADQCQITVECWAETASAADALADQVTAAIAAAPAAVGAVVLGRSSAADVELGVDSTVLNVEWWA